MHPRALLALGHDLVATGLAWIAAYWLRFNFDIPREFWIAGWKTLAGVMPLYGAVYLGLGLYRGIWRYSSMGDLRRLLAAVLIGACVVAGAVVASGFYGVPRSVLILHPILLLMVMGGDRFLYRAWKDGHLAFLRQDAKKPVLVIGSGDPAAMLLGELGRSREWHAVGVLDDNAARHGRRINDVPVLGPLDTVGESARRLGVAHAIIAMPSASPSARRRAVELANAAGLTVLTVPAFDDLMGGRVSISQVRRVELEDLLGREQVQLDDAGLQGLLSGKVVLVTGAGGSIGSELCRQIARFGPARLVFYEVSEFALYRMEQEFAGRWPRLPVTCAIGDVRDAERLAEVFAEHRPAVVFHAAAYKHVPMMEGENAWQAVRNNVLGTWRVARAAVACGAREFVLVSTDKAVNPTNVMGASKRLAELVCQAVQAGADCAARGDTRFVMVRFGNVLGSSGSVIPKFKEQITAGGPVTVTHPDIVRYFMLIPEAAQLVLQAGLMASEGPEGGRIFVLDMGEPIRIADLARDMIRLSGFSETEVRIEFTGLRPGEKLYEELLADGETTLPTPHPKLRIHRPEAARDTAWLARLGEWLAAPTRSADAVRRDLAAWVPEYAPASADE